VITRRKAVRSEPIEFLERRLLLSITPATLYSFTAAADGQAPEAITVGANGNLYGTTEIGGTDSVGSVWEMDQGESTVSTRYSFTNSTDGEYPRGIAVDSAGNLYGTCQLGGTFDVGTVWELASGGTTVSTLYAFTNGNIHADGAYPLGITIDASGNLYGVTETGGDDGLGTVWELPSGGDSVTTLYSFTGGSDGEYPVSVTMDDSGTLYGTTALGGNGGDGTAWKLLGGGDSVTVLYTFPDQGGSPVYPNGITFDGSNLFGTTNYGGADSDGTLWQLIDGNTSINTLYSFTSGSDGGGPAGITSLDVGNLFGVAQYGGGDGYGSVYEVPVTPLNGQFIGDIPATAELGDTISPDLQITDPAVGASVDGDEVTNYYISTTPNLAGIVGQPVDTNEYELSLSAGDSYAENEDVAIPDAINSGTYYLVAQIDANQTVVAVDTNVIAVSDPIHIGPVLSAQFIARIPASVSAGQTIYPGWEITDAPDAAPVNDGLEYTDYYLSTTPDLSGIVGPALVTNEYILNLDPGDSTFESPDVTIPDDVDAGTYYLVAQIDANQTINPGDMNNIAASTAFSIGADISGGFSDQPPDLASPGDSGQISFFLSNAAGSGEAKGSYSVTFLLENGAPDLGNGDIPAGSASGVIDVAGGDTSDPILANLNFPGNITTGFYYVVATINDSGGGIIDGDTTDKTFTSEPIQVHGSYIFQSVYSFTSDDYSLDTEGVGGFAMDSNGDMYGTTNGGGVYGDGILWEWAKGSDTAATIYSFSLADGEDPLAVAVDSNGNLFGTTTGDYNNDRSGGADEFGTIWELPKGSHTLTTLYTFGQAPYVNGTGIDPFGITIDSNGNLYGTTEYGLFINPFSNVNGGVYYELGDGSIWELPKGSNTLTTLYTPIDDPNFNNAGHPFQQMYELTIDGNGNLYGVNDGGGVYNAGSVWELAKGSDTVSTLYSFTVPGIVGSSPRGIALDKQGDLFGTNYGSGAYGWGDVWELARGSSTLTNLFSFPYIPGYVTGEGPYGIAIDSGGNLFGASGGGADDPDGGIFELQTAVLTGQFTGAIPSAIEAGYAILPALQLSTPAYAAGPITGDETTDYYLSTTPDVSGMLLPLAENEYALDLNPGSSDTVSQDVTIPGDVDPGNYYLVAQIDADQAINPDDTDNIVVNGPIKIVAPFTNLAGGVLTISDPADDGGDDTITVSSDGTGVTADFNGSASMVYQQSKVDGIDVSAGNGNDTVNIGTGAPPVSVQGGTGVDTVNVGHYDAAYYYDDVPNNSTAGLVVQGSGTVTLATSNTYGGSTTIDSGTVAVTAAGGLPAGNNVVNNGNLDIDANSIVGQISGNGTLTLDPATLQLAQNSPGITSTIGLLIINTGSTLDIANNALLANESDVTLSQIAAWVQDKTITSSLFSGPHAIASRAIGYGDHSADPLAVPAGDVEVKYVPTGDANLDGVVDIKDLTRAINDLGLSTGYSGGDVANQGIVNITDIADIINDLGATLNAAGDGAAIVPAHGAMTPPAAGAAGGSLFSDSPVQADWLEGGGSILSE